MIDGNAQGGEDEVADSSGIIGVLSSSLSAAAEYPVATLFERKN
jgi:hypothetical protein